MFNSERKGIVPLVVISLLLLASVISVIYLGGWFQIFKDQVQEDFQKKDLKRTLEVRAIDENYMTVYNDFGKDVKLSSVVIGGQKCDLGNVTLKAGVNFVDIGLCAKSVGDVESTETVLITEEGVKSEFEIIRDVVRNPLIVNFKFGACEFEKGYVRLMGLSDLSMGHAEVGNSYLYTYSVCVRHINYTVSTVSGPIRNDLLFLDARNNSHVFTTQGSIYIAPSVWYNISLYSSGGVYASAISPTAPDSSYTCVFALDLDDVFGSMIGDCDSTDLPDRFWAKIS